MNPRQKFKISPFLLFASTLGITCFTFRKKILGKLCLSIVNRAKKYQRQFYPDRIILIRHGQSEANINPSLYRTIPDAKINLTQKGKEQALKASEELSKIVGKGSVKFYVSPYIRTIQTFERVRSLLTNNKITFQFDPRLREQELGNFHDFYDNIMKERDIVGSFYYRFTNGESGADLYNRATLFLSSFFREIKKYNEKKYDNVVIICHRFFMRAFITAFFKMNVDDFEKIKDAPNCGLWVIEKNEQGKYKLKTDLPRI